MDQPLALVVVPPWATCGSSNLFEASVSVICKRGYDVFILIATLQNGSRAEDNARAMAESLSHLPLIGCSHNTYNCDRQTLQSKSEVELRSSYVANGTLPDSLESLLKKRPMAAIYVHHCWNLKLACEIQNRVSSAFGSRPPILCETHDIQCQNMDILQRESMAEKRIASEETEAAEIGLCALADCLIHINHDDFRFFYERLPQRRHALLPPTIAPKSEAALQALRDKIDPAASKLIYVAAQNYWNGQTTCWLLEKVMPRVDGMRENLLIVGKVAYWMQNYRPDLYDTFAENFVGEVASISDVYVKAKVVLVPALGGSGSSIKLLEAMCVGRPTVGTPEITRGLDSETLSRLPITIAEGEAEFAAAVESALKVSHTTTLKPMVDMYDQEVSGEVYRARLDRILDSVLDDNTPPQAIDSFSKMPRRIIRKIKSYWCHQPH